jgi:hypothetical protein
MEPPPAGGEGQSASGCPCAAGGSADPQLHTLHGLVADMRLKMTALMYSDLAGDDKTLLGWRSTWSALVQRCALPSPLRTGPTRQLHVICCDAPL